MACSNTIQLISYWFGHIGVGEWRTLDIDGAAGLDATRIRANTVARERQSSNIKLISRGLACGGHLLLGCSGLDLESRNRASELCSCLTNTEGNVGLP